MSPHMALSMIDACGASNNLLHKFSVYKLNKYCILTLYMASVGTQPLDLNKFHKPSPTLRKFLS
jgi:hypothetical protein